MNRETIVEHGLSFGLPPTSIVIGCTSRVRILSSRYAYVAAIKDIAEREGLKRDLGARPIRYRSLVSTHLQGFLGLPLPLLQ